MTKGPLSQSSRGNRRFLNLLIPLYLFLCGLIGKASGTECWRRKLSVGGYFWVHVNNTIKCPMSWQWTVSDLCCYDTYDRFEERPFCCYSDTYKLALAVGFICLVLLGSSFSIFCCWFYNLPHHLLYILTCRKFRLNDWLVKTRNGPYVDPSFYSGDPFWARGVESQPYPLRPMPPRIFYPAPPANMKFRWDMGQGDLPLFILASRQFHRNPYSARPNDRTAITSTHHNHQAISTVSITSDSRRSSITTLAERDSQSAVGGGRDIFSGGKNKNNWNSNQNQNNNHHHRMSVTSSNIINQNNAPAVPFVINIDEVEAATELMECIKLMEEKVEAKEYNKTSWTISESLGEPLTGEENHGIFMTNASRGDSYDFRNNSNNNSGSNILAITETAHNHNGSCQQINTSTSRGGSGGGENSMARNLNKMSIESLNQQLSSSLGLSINNLPNVHVIGNFGGNNSMMETIAEDDDSVSDDLDYQFSRPGSQPSNGENSRGISGRRSSSSDSGVNSNSNTNFENSAEPLRISSALDRIVTRARAEIPFRPSLPGIVPENNLEDLSVQGRLTQRNVMRRNSAPVNF